MMPLPTRFAVPLDQLWPLAMTTALLCYGMAEAPPTVPHAAGCPSPMPLSERVPEAPLDLSADFVFTADHNLQWVVGGVVDPTLTMFRGHTYVIDLTAVPGEHPFVINAAATNPFAPLLAGPAFAESITFTPTASMPATIYYHCEVHYTSMTGRIDLIDPPCPSDQNADRTVNVSDFGLFANAYGAPCSGCSADLNADGQVNVSDFGLFANAYGRACP